MAFVFLFFLMPALFWLFEFHSLRMKLPSHLLCSQSFSLSQHHCTPVFPMWPQSEINTPWSIDDREYSPLNLTEKDWRRREERSEERGQIGWRLRWMDYHEWKRKKLGGECDASVRLWWMLMSRAFMLPILCVFYILDVNASKYSSGTTFFDKFSFPFWKDVGVKMKKNMHLCCKIFISTFSLKQVREIFWKCSFTVCCNFKENRIRKTI